MPSPVLMAPLVVNGKIRPAPPAQMITALALNSRIVPVRISIAVTPRQTPSSTIRSVEKYSSNRRMLGYCREVWNSVWRIWKPVLSAAYQVRSTFMPPNGLTATWPVLSRLHGQPQCSSWVSSFGASLMKSSTASWSVSQSPPETVSLK